jgi:hypothetical protein
MEVYRKMLSHNYHLILLWNKYAITLSVNSLAVVLFACEVGLSYLGGKQ